MNTDWFDSMSLDVQYAVRGLRAKPGFTTAVVVTLALGLGANTAIFSVVDRLLFRTPPRLAVPSLTHRVYLGAAADGQVSFNWGVPYAGYVDLTSWTRSFRRTAEIAEPKLAVGTSIDAREMNVGVVSASFFGFFDAPPALGRYFSSAEDTPPNGTPVLVLSYAFWKTRYGGRPDVLGGKLQVGPTVFEIIGVAPHGFVGLWPETPPVAFIPITASAGASGMRYGQDNWWQSYAWVFSQMIAQRKPGVSIAAADADLTNAYLRSYQAQYARAPGLPSPKLARLQAVAAPILSERGPKESSVAKVATLVGAMAIIVLLIACANVANLLLARAFSRRREIAVRLALGASRRRLFSQLLTESILIAGLAGVAGLLVAQWGASLLRALFLPEGAQSSVMGDMRTLAIAGAAVLVTGLLTGLAPAWQARRADLTRDLKAGARGGTLPRSRTRSALVIVQGTLSVVLLIGAGLFVRSLDNVRALRLGYDVDPVLVVNLNMRGLDLDSAHAVALRRRLLEAVQSFPGVEHAALNTSIPFRDNSSFDLYITGVDSVSRLGTFFVNAVTPDYFATMGTRILRGRGIGPEDVANAPRAMVVSQAMARVLWPHSDPIGQCVKIDARTVPCTYVVGIAENIKNNSLSDEPGLYYYVSTEQFLPQNAGLVLRMRGDAARQAEAIRSTLQRLMPGASYVTATPLADIIGGQESAWKLGASIFVLFGLLALVLAGVGLYSVIAYNTAQQSHEIGVRIALGAQLSDLVSLIVGHGVHHAVLGIVLGCVIAFGSARMVSPLLFDESPRDPVIYALVAGVLFAVAIIASFVPARRAAQTDPNVALRNE